MNKPAVFGAAALAALAAVSLWITRHDSVQVAPTQTQPVAVVSSDAAPASKRVAESEQRAGDTPPANVPMISAVDVDEYSEDPAKMFKADESGNLLLKERTRLNVEKLSWLYTPEELQQKLAVIERTLPPAAYRQLLDLMDRYKNFSVAAKQSYPPDKAPTTVEEAAAQYDGLHALRIAHFGADATNAMFGREERLGRKLLEFMSLEQHQGLSLEEKAMKAQEMLQQSPELAAAYDENRVAIQE